MLDYQQRETTRGFLRAHPGRESEVVRKDYAEFATGVGVLAIFAEEAQERYIPGSTKAAKNEGIVLEFRVADVD
jgi:hypothetical protein